MNITNVKVTQLNGNSKLEAMADITIDNAIKIQGFKIIAGEKGYFVSMPSKADRNGEYHDTVYPVTAEARKQLTEAVLDAFTKDRLERDATPALSDVRLPWDVKDSPAGNTEEKMSDAKPEALKAEAKKSQMEKLTEAPLKETKTEVSKDRASIKDQLTELSKSAESQSVKTAKTIKSKTKEDITL